MTDHRSPIRYLAAIAAGLLLATLPFWRYLPLGGALAAHMDHEPRHGGQLGMVGDHHIEVVRRRGQVEVFVSDALRRPVQPRSGRVIFDRRVTEALSWENHRFIAGDRPATEIDVRLDVGKQLALSFDFSDDS